MLIWVYAVHLSLFFFLIYDPYNEKDSYHIHVYADNDNLHERMLPESAGIEPATSRVGTYPLVLLAESFAASLDTVT